FVSWPPFITRDTSAGNGCRFQMKWNGPRPAVQDARLAIIQKFVLMTKKRLYKMMDKNSLEKSHTRPPLSLPFYYGWFVISLCFLTTLTSAGVRSSPSVLIHALEAEFGWSRTLIASAVSMNLLLFGVAAPLSGFLIDRFGPRKV